MIPKEIQEKIEAQFPLMSKDSPSYDKHGEGWNTQSEAQRDGAKFGYSLAEKEIERLKGLLKEVVSGNGEGKFNVYKWDNFKTTHNL